MARRHVSFVPTGGRCVNRGGTKSTTGVLGTLGNRPCPNTANGATLASSARPTSGIFANNLVKRPMANVHRVSGKSVMFGFVTGKRLSTSSTPITDSIARDSFGLR